MHHWLRGMDAPAHQVDAVLEARLRIATLIFKLLKHHWEDKGRAPAYSRALGKENFTNETNAPPSIANRHRFIYQSLIHQTC